MVKLQHLLALGGLAAAASRALTLDYRALARQASLDAVEIKHADGAGRACPERLIELDSPEFQGRDRRRGGLIHHRPTGELADRERPPARRDLLSLAGLERMFAAYFCNWTVYSRRFSPADMPFRDLTHIIYAFARTDPESGEVSLSDPYADLEMPLRLANGAINELNVMKRQNRKLFVLLSIGGWSYSSDLTAAFSTPAGRERFASSAVRLVELYHFDGLDVDWEFPEDDAQADQYLDVLVRLKEGLDALALRLGLRRNQFQLTIAAPASIDTIRLLRLREMDRYLSFWNVMTYDLAGNWSSTTEYHSSLYPGPGSSPGADNVVQAYVRSGIPSTKLLLGMPLYGRSFNHTPGLGAPFDGVVPAKPENGMHNVRDLPLPHCPEAVDLDRVSAYCKNGSVFVGYDNAITARYKAIYALQNRLGGGMWWEASQDRPGDESLIKAFMDTFGRQEFYADPYGDERCNWIS